MVNNLADWQAQAGFHFSFLLDNNNYVTLWLHLMDGRFSRGEWRLQDAVLESIQRESAMDTKLMSWPAEFLEPAPAAGHPI